MTEGFSAMMSIFPMGVGDFEKCCLEGTRQGFWWVASRNLSFRVKLAIGDGFRQVFYGGAEET